MFTKRIIPCLDVKEGKVVKGVNFVGLKEVGDPVALARRYYEQGADEIVFLDISATNEGRKTMADVARQVAKEIFIPFTIGGGIRSIDDITTLLRSGADKVSLNRKGAEIFGSQCIVAAIDARKRSDGSGWNVFINGGRKDTGIDLIDWVRQVTALGAGEILLTSMDADGTRNGFDLEMLRAVNAIIDVPLIASGGCGTMEHIAEVLESDVADAALAASIFHYGDHSVQEVKDDLSARGIPVRREVSA